MNESTFSCPFCSFKDADSYFLTLHVEELHTEDSPFVVRSPVPSSGFVYTPERGSSVPTPPNEDLDDYVQCPIEQCGEEVQLAQLNDHLDLHTAEDETVDDQLDSKLSSSRKNFTAEIPEALRDRRARHKSSVLTNHKSGLGRSIFGFGLTSKSRIKQRPEEHEKNGIRLGVRIAHLGYR